MQAEYLRRFGKHGVIVRHGTDQQPVVQPGDLADEFVRIGFAGSVTARSAFACLLDTLDGMEWEIAGRPVALVLLGGRFDLWSRVPRRIEVLGWQSVESTIRLLSRCCVNYLPQPFEPERRAFAQFSFPSKLTTYLAAGVPILLHAPGHASLPSYFARRPFGALCDCLDASDLQRVLTRLVADQPLRRQAQRQGALALNEEFSAACFERSFREFLGLRSDVAAP